MALSLGTAGHCCETSFATGVLPLIGPKAAGVGMPGAGGVGAETLERGGGEMVGGPTEITVVIVGGFTVTPGGLTETVTWVEAGGGFGRDADGGGGGLTLGGGEGGGMFGRVTVTFGGEGGKDKLGGGGGETEGGVGIDIEDGLGMEIEGDVVEDTVGGVITMTGGEI